MERNIEHEVITALAEKDINLTLYTSRDGFKIGCITDPKDYDKMEMHEFTGTTLKAALKQMIRDPKFTGAIGSDLFLKLNANDQAADNPVDIIDTLSILNPYLRELRNAFDKALQSAAAAVEDQDTATVTAKVVITQDENAPDFINEAKMFRAAKFSVNVGIKRDITQYKGQTPEFITRTVDGRMLMIDPDRQISLDEAIRQAEKESGNAPPEPDLMADAPVDPAGDRQEPDGEPDDEDDDSDGSEDQTA